MTNLDVWYSHFDVEVDAQGFRTASRPGGAQAGRGQRGESSHPRQPARLRQAHARRRRASDASSATHPSSNPSTSSSHGVERIQIEEFFRGVIHRYRRTLPSDRRHLLEGFRFADVARKVVGVGSVGTRALIVLMLGRDDADPLLLQAKEAQASVLEAFVGRSERRSHGERVVHGQRLMQANSDIFLGWDQVRGIDGVEHDYYVRQLRDWKGAAMVEVMSPTTMAIYARDAAPPSPGPTPARATASPSPRTSAAATPSTERSRVLGGVRRSERAGLRHARSGREGRSHHRPARASEHGESVESATGGAASRTADGGGRCSPPPSPSAGGRGPPTRTPDRRREGGRSRRWPPCGQGGLRWSGRAGAPVRRTRVLQGEDDVQHGEHRKVGGVVGHRRRWPCFDGLHEERRERSDAGADNLDRRRVFRHAAIATCS